MRLLWRTHPSENRPERHPDKSSEMDRGAAVTAGLVPSSVLFEIGLKLGASKS